MVIWISIYFIGVFVCGLVQLYTQHLRLVGVDRRRWHHPPERSPYTVSYTHLTLPTT